MSPVFFLLLSIYAACFFMPACANKSATETKIDRVSLPEIKSWSVEIKISGGMTGRGNGEVLISSDGQIEAAKPALPGSKPLHCSAKLSQQELQALNESVKGSSPAEWQKRRLNAAAPDAYEYSLNLTVLKSGGKRQEYKVKWYDNTRNNLPEDLKPLSDEVLEAKEKTIQKCPR